VARISDLTVGGSILRQKNISLNMKLNFGNLTEHHHPPPTGDLSSLWTAPSFVPACAMFTETPGKTETGFFGNGNGLIACFAGPDRLIFDGPTNFLLSDWALP
jgi:hypothetical protein